MSVVVSLVGALVAGFLSSGGEAAVAPREAPPEGPAIADPGLVITDDGIWLYGTSVGGTHVPVFRLAADGGWEARGDAAPTLPSWVASDSAIVWAPEVVAVTDGYTLLGAMRHGVSGAMCIAAGTSTGPEGPFVFSRRDPLVCQEGLGGSIDPDLFTDADGSTYLIWKSDGNCCDRPSGI